MNQFDAFISSLTFWAVMSLFIVAGIVLLVGFGYLAFQWFRYRNREKYSLGFILLEVRLPRDNEIKIDAAEQLFASLHNLYSSDWFKKLTTLRIILVLRLWLSKKISAFMFLVPLNFKI